MKKENIMLIIGKRGTGMDLGWLKKMKWHKIVSYIPIIIGVIVLIFIFVYLAPIAWEQMQEDIRNNITVWRN